MPFLRDEGPPVSRETIDDARRNLPIEYGYRVVSERGRTVLLVRVPKAKPDYLHELAEVALYVGLDEVKSAKDVLLIGDEKVCRLEPVLLRDHIRERKAEDANVVQDLVRKLDRNFGFTVVDHKFNMSQHSFAVRIPRNSVAELTSEDVQQIRAALQPWTPRLRDVQAAYLVSDTDFERVGRRVFLELVDPEAAEALAKPAPATPLRAGVILDKHGSTVPTGVLPSGGLPMPGTAPTMPPPHVMPQVFQTPPQPVSLLKGTGTPALPTDPVARNFVQSALRDSAPPAPAAAPPPPPPAPEPPAREFVPAHQTNEYEVFVAKPKTGAPPAPLAAPPPPPPAPPAPPPAPAYAPPPPAPPPEPAAAPARAPPLNTGPMPGEAAGPKPSFVQTVHHDEYEVFVSKRVAPDAQAVDRPRDEVTDIVAKSATIPVVGPSQDSGGRVVVTVSEKPAPPPAQTPTAQAFLPLAAVLESAGYRIVRDLEVEGTTFELAAHKDGGKRILAKAMPRLGAAEVKSLAAVAQRLGADACLAVAGDVEEGARLAAWGTRVEVLSVDDVDRLTL